MAGASLVIGGVDIFIKSQVGAIATLVAVRAIRQQWRQAVYENGLTGETYARFSQIPFALAGELFVYRDAEAAKRWDEEGAVPETHNSMVHLIADQNGLVVVVDQKDAEINLILERIESSLNDPKLVIPVSEAA